MSRRYKERQHYRQNEADRTTPQWMGNKGGAKAMPVFRAERLPVESGVRLVRVFVEGYEDVAFWRGIFSDYESDSLRFEINVPQRADLAKGKKVLLGMLDESSPDLLLCMDSDFDYLFNGTTEQSRIVNSSPFVFHTYGYSSENYLCYAPSLHSVCVKATKNDIRIFDFEDFMAEYSRIIFPLFIWYVQSAHSKTENTFTLLEFRTSVKLNYLEVEHNGRDTLVWLKRQVDKKLAILESKNPEIADRMDRIERLIRSRGVDPENTYLFMQGHTLLDNVVMVMLHAVCEQLKIMCSEQIQRSMKTGLALKNEQSNYTNAQRSVRDILLDNEGYKDCPLYQMVRRDIELYLEGLGK